MKTVAVIVAGGRSTRARTEVPKQFIQFCGKPLIQHSIDVLERCAHVSKIIVALNHEYFDFPLIGSKIVRTIGGETRSQSVANCLEVAATFSPDNVLIHDAARPGLDEAVIDEIHEALKVADGCFPSLIVSDALWKCDSNQRVINKIERSNTFRAQTPQAFNATKFIEAFRKRDSNFDYVDDVEIGLSFGLNIIAIKGDEKYGKITYPEDFEKFTQWFNRSSIMIRTGMGFDAHRFCEGDFVTLCGHAIPYSHSLDGHSDADVAWHALVDAILGALGEGDIGQVFPPSDIKWKGAKSKLFLEFAVEKAAQKGARINNIDLTIVCEAPKIGPYREILRENTAKILGIESEHVNIKATTTERMGFTGRKEGIAAYAIATLTM